MDIKIKLLSLLLVSALFSASVALAQVWPQLAGLIL